MMSFCLFMFVARGSCHAPQRELAGRCKRLRVESARVCRMCSWAKGGSGVVAVRVFVFVGCVSVCQCDS